MDLSQRKIDILRQIEGMFAIHDCGTVTFKFEDADGDCGTLELGFGRPTPVVVHDPLAPVPIPAPKK